MQGGLVLLCGVSTERTMTWAITQKNVLMNCQVWCIIRLSWGCTGFDGEGWSRVASRGALASLTTEQTLRCQNTCLRGRFQLCSPSVGCVVEISLVTCG